MVAIVHIALISLVLLLPIALVALLAWYYVCCHRKWHPRPERPM